MVGFWLEVNFIILPFILGILGIVLMHDENKYDMQKQLWIAVPVHKMSYFFSKFWVVLIFSAAFMLLTAVASVLFSVLSGYVAFEWKSIVFLLEKCMEIAVLTSLAILPVLAAAVGHKDYVFPVCMTLLYVFSGFFMASVNPYAHPLSCVSVILNRNGDIFGRFVKSACLCAAGFSATLYGNLGWCCIFAGSCFLKTKKMK